MPTIIVIWFGPDAADETGLAPGPELKLAQATAELRLFRSWWHASQEIELIIRAHVDQVRHAVGQRE